MKDLLRMPEAFVGLAENGQKTPAAGISPAVTSAGPVSPEKCSSTSTPFLTRASLVERSGTQRQNLSLFLLVSKLRVGVIQSWRRVHRAVLSEVALEYHHLTMQATQQGRLSEWARLILGLRFDLAMLRFVPMTVLAWSSAQQ